MIDLNLLEKGVSYQELKECYIIFICTFDPFGSGMHRYTFRSTCQENKDLCLEDKSVKVFFNTKGIRDDISEEAGKLLRYLDSRECSSELTRRLDAEVEKARHNELWRREYMKTLLHDMEVRQEGREEGRKEGIEEGQARVNMLNQRLAELGRTTDIIKSAEDPGYQEQLFSELGI